MDEACAITTVVPTRVAPLVDRRIRRRVRRRRVPVLRGIGTAVIVVANGAVPEGVAAAHLPLIVSTTTPEPVQHGAARRPLALVDRYAVARRRVGVARAGTRTAGAQSTNVSTGAVGRDAAEDAAVLRSLAAAERVGVAEAGRQRSPLRGRGSISGDRARVRGGSRRGRGETGAGADTDTRARARARAHTHTCGRGTSLRPFVLVWRCTRQADKITTSTSMPPRQAALGRVVWA